MAESTSQSFFISVFHASAAAERIFSQRTKHASLQKTFSQEKRLRCPRSVACLSLPGGYRSLDEQDSDRGAGASSFAHQRRLRCVSGKQRQSLHHLRRSN